MSSGRSRQTESRSGFVVRKGEKRSFATRRGPFCSRRGGGWVTHAVMGLGEPVPAMWFDAVATPGGAQLLSTRVLEPLTGGDLGQFKWPGLTVASGPACFHCFIILFLFIQTASGFLNTQSNLLCSKIYLTLHSGSLNYEEQLYSWE
jgi:hypothetical protein